MDIISILISWVQSIDPAIRITVASFAIMLETTALVGLVFPGDSALLLAATGTVGLHDWLWLIFGSIVGALIGESTAFWIGAYLGDKIKNSKIGKKIGPEKWKAAEDYLAKRGIIAVFTSRFLPVFHSIVPLVAGIAHMRFRKFLIATIPACILWSFIYVSLGAFIGISYQQLATEVRFAGYILLGIVVTIIVIKFLIKKNQKQNERPNL